MNIKNDKHFLKHVLQYKQTNKQTNKQQSMTSLEHRLHISNRNGFNWPEKSYNGFNGENLTHGMNPALPGPKRDCLWIVRHIKYFVFSRLLEGYS